MQIIFLSVQVKATSHFFHMHHLDALWCEETYKKNKKTNQLHELKRTTWRAKTVQTHQCHRQAVCVRNCRDSSWENTRDHPLPSPPLRCLVESSVRARQWERDRARPRWGDLTHHQGGAVDEGLNPQVNRRVRNTPFKREGVARRGKQEPHPSLVCWRNRLPGASQRWGTGGWRIWFLWWTACRMPSPPSAKTQTWTCPRSPWWAARARARARCWRTSSASK